jgi:D-cysteine desulfhydrase family pyridoxal phosphate-dependent enzyme
MMKAIDRFNDIRRLSFGHYPTPVEELPRLRAELALETGSCPRIFAKRDDYTGPGFGGNKVRKLEYVLAQAVADGAEAVITSGGLKSNHARVTAAMCARLGLRCTLVMNPAAVMHEGLSPASLAMDAMYGAEVVRVGSRAERAPTVEAIAWKLRSEGRNVAVIPLGASMPLGAMGFVRAVSEAKSQVEAMDVKIDWIFHSSSSGGTQAGIAAGCRLFDWQVKVMGVSPDDPSDSIAADVSRNIRGLSEMLDLALDEKVEVLDEYTGEGYGIPSPHGDEAIALLARTEGITLDPVYTAKAMAALIDWIRKGRLSADENALFWHTGGQLALFYVPEK